MEVVRHQKESGFTFLLSTQAGSMPKLPLETSPVGHRKARAFGKMFPQGHLDKPPQSRGRGVPGGLSGHLWMLLVQNSPWHTFQISALSHLKCSPPNRLAHVSFSSTKANGDVIRKFKQARFLILDLRARPSLQSVKSFVQLC